MTARKLTWYQVGLMAVGMLLGTAGWKLDMPWLIQTGLMVGGSSLMSIGLDSIITRKTSFSNSSESGGSTYNYTYTDIEAMAWGAFSILLGLLAFMEGLLWLIYTLPDILAYLRT
ncbi:MAG: hypothetical protein QNK27_02500 [Desulfuromusa sp.]|nr:hypothetical protein [Desulfuromusa sp.]